jgi:hypothetical protein
MMRAGALVVLAVATPLLAPTPAAAQTGAARCAFLCAPSLKIEPTITIENIAGRPRIDANGIVVRPSRERVFELVVAADVPTRFPRIGVTFEAIFAPFGETGVHPFTGEPAPTGGSIRNNGIEIESELNFHLFGEEMTDGWVSSHVDLVDQFSPGETPRANSVYTHKLDFEWDTAFHLFHRLPTPWLKDVELELSLDYLATGLPKRGDVIDGERFLDKASPWSLSLVFVMPLAPLP